MNDVFPRLFRVDQVIEAQSLADPAVATRAALAELPASSFIRSGMTVAVCAGSRGIANYDVIVRAVCQRVEGPRGRGVYCPGDGQPWRGNRRWATGGAGALWHHPERDGGAGQEQHGGGRAGPRRRTHPSIRTAMRRGPMPSCWSTGSSRIRISTVAIESGLMKMAVVGLGKQKGAHQFHQATVRLGHAQALLQAGVKCCNGAGLSLASAFSRTRFTRRRGLRQCRRARWSSRRRDCSRRRGA